MYFVELHTQMNYIFSAEIFLISKTPKNLYSKNAIEFSLYKSHSNIFFSSNPSQIGRCDGQQCYGEL